MSDKKRKIMLPNTTVTTEELDDAREIMTVIDEVIAIDYPEIKFEHVLLWWVACDSAEA